MFIRSETTIPTFRCILAILSTIVLSVSVFAQKSKIVEGGVVNGIPYASTGFENINMTNGNLSLSFPLASLQGRGQAGFAYYMTYNSKLWRTQSNQVYTQGYEPNPTDQNFLADSLEGGWRPGAEGQKYELNVWNRQSGMDAPTGNECALSTRWMLVHQWKVTIDAPDGRKIEFRPTGYSDIEPGNSTGIGTGYFAVQPNGSVNGVSGPSTGCTFSTSSPTYERMTYYSSDGSGIRLTFANGEPLGFVWEMSMPDGSKITQLTGKQRISDRNGNYVEQAVVTLPDSTQAQGWVDQVGRYVARKADTAPNEDTYYQLGFNGELLTWKVRWKDVHVRRNYTTTCINCPANQRGPVINTQAIMVFRVVDQIVLPTQLGVQPYEFEYHAKDQDDQNLSSGWGEVKSITMPSGASVNYGYKLSALTSSEAYDEILAGEIFLRVDQIMERAGTLNKKELIYLEEYDGQTTTKEDIWHYGTSRSGSSVSAPDGSISYQYFWDIVVDEQKGGQVYKEIKADGTKVERVWANNLPVGVVFGSGARLNSFVKTEFTTITDAAGNPSLTAIRDYDYDRNGNLLSVAEYDWIPASSSSIQRDTHGIVTGFTGLTPARTTTTEYYNPTPSFSSQAGSPNVYYISSAPALRNLASASEVKNTAGTPVSRTEITYDNSTTPIKGNPTQTKVWDSFKNGTVQEYSAPLTSTNSISTSATYDDFGNVTLLTDAKGVETTITYGCIDGNTSCAGTLSNLYPTKTETASNYSSLKRTSSAIYDFHTGRVTSSKDVDNNLTNATEYDALGRPKKIITAAGNSTYESWTTTDYYDSGRYIVVKSDLVVKGDGKKVAVQFFDQLGRVRLSKTLEDAATQLATNETDGIKVQTRYKFASGYTYQLTSSPYKANYPGNETDPTMGWTLSTAWSNGRRSEVQTFSGSGLPTAFGGSNSNSTGIVRTDSDSDRTLVTDQAQRSRISKTNALGQLKEVWEILGASDTGSETVSFPGTTIAHGFKTTYSYDTLNNLITVNQGAQTRSFSYSSLSRLLTANNPESGLIEYKYDNNGNLAWKKDARLVETSYVYDALNRVTNRNYSTPGGTPSNYQASPNVTYTYDDKANAKGKLTRVSTGTGANASTTEYTSFDILGRVTGSKQITDGVTYGAGGTITDPSKDNAMTYTYNLSGALIEQQYPSGRRVENVLDPTGDLKTVKSNKNSSTVLKLVYANNFTFNAAGAVTSMQLGNTNWESTVFNSRLQPTQIALGTNPNGTNKLDLDYTYGAEQNNGNVLSQTITVPTVGSNPGFTAIQNYTYDSLNRIMDADEKPFGWTQANCDSDPTKCWKQTFVYDRYGNRTFDTVQNRTTTIPSGCPAAVCNPSANASDNKLKTSDGYFFDNSGNTIEDAEERTFIYDGENMQVEVKNSSDQTVGKYFYDGDGKRIKKFVPSTGETTTFVYDAAGKLVAEYSTIVASANDAKVAYLTSDHLGSPRINTDRNGAVTARHDYHPFGEEISTSQRTVGLNYADDKVRKQFTGYERDEETELDFAQARYFSSGFGRFSTPDDFFNDSQPQAPQSWNKYLYVRNNPLRLIDPSGKKADVTVTRDKKKKTGTIVISADYALYAGEGQNVTEEQLAAQKKLLEDQVRSTYSGTFKGKDGFTYTVSTDISVTIVKNESEAVEGGNSGKYDNIVEVGNKKVAYGVERGDETGDVFYKQADDVTFRKSGENFDRAMVSLHPDAAVESNLYGHATGHFLGVPNTTKQGDVMSPAQPSATRLSYTDRTIMFGSQISAAAAKTMPVTETRRARVQPANESYVWANSIKFGSVN